MPQVPYNPVRQVGLENIGVSAPGVNAPLAAFGGAQAEAMSHLGSALERAGDEIFARAMAIQQVNNEAEAREADVQYMTEAGQLHANYNALQGKDRVDAFPKYMADLKESRARIRDGLSNPASARMFDSQSMGTMGRTIFNGAGVAASAQKDYTIGAAEAQQKLDIKTVGDNPDDEGLFQDKLQRIEESSRSLSAMRGEGPEQEDFRVKAAKSAAWSERIMGMSKKRPFEAQKLLESNRTQMFEADYRRAENIVTATGRSVGAANIADKAYDPTHTKTLKEMQDDAEGMAREQNPDDPLLAKQAVSNLNTKYNQARYAEKQEADEIKAQTEDLITKYKPQSLQEFLQLPDADKLYSSMRPSERSALPGKINRYSDSVSREANDEEFRRLKGMAASDSPEARSEFLEYDPTRSKLSQGQILNIMQLQQKMKKQAVEDPRVSRALGWMKSSAGAQLEALGIYNRTPANKDDYDKYVGAMQASIDAWQQEYGKPPGIKEITETIGPQILRQRTEPYLFFFSQKTPFYKQDVPEDFAAKARKIQGDTNLSDQAIYKLWLQYQMKEFYSKAPKTMNERFAP